MGQLTKWERFERISKILQLIVLIVGVTALFQIPCQIKQNRQAVDKNTFDILWKLDTRLREGLNANIYLAIEHNRPVLTKKITTDDLDIYLADLSSIEDARERDLISDEDVYSWFWNNIVDTYGNKEVMAYITALQKEDSEYYKDFVNLYNRVQQYSKLKEKK